MKQDSGSGGFSSLMSAALERQTLSATAIWQLLLVAQESQTCPLNLLLEEVGKEPGAGAFFRAGELSALCLDVALVEITVDPQEIRGLSYSCHLCPSPQEQWQVNSHVLLHSRVTIVDQGAVFEESKKKGFSMWHLRS